jgi:signal transduction histidine kinase/iron only hydrogenase large subunit-like protein
MAEINENDSLVSTIKDRCRVCYTCVRECPAKAIKIINGQATILPERCIGCGNCTKVCSQGAKVYKQSINQVKNLLHSNERVAAIVAPSFPAEFYDFGDYKKVVGAIRELGFSLVCEVSFGADIVARKYESLWSNSSEKYLSTDCPAIVSYIEHYHPEIIKNLAPIVSPSVAMARVLRHIHGEDLKIVFIGPCIAKKAESAELNEAITFTELRRMLERNNINLDNVKPSCFDPPVSGKGALFPITRGLIQNLNIYDQFDENEIIVAEGRINFQEAIKEFCAGLINNNHLELLCCEGCIMGPGMSVNNRKYARVTMVNNYVNEKLKNFDYQEWENNINKFINLDFSRGFVAKDQRLKDPLETEIEDVLRLMGKYNKSDYLDCGACGYDTCREHAIAIINGLAENEMCLPYTIEKLHNSIGELEISNQQLASMQQTLRQTEKLASMGQLSAGIAHELNNPLGILIMYSNILLEETPKESEHYNDLKLIVEQANRCKKIVSGLLNFARKNQINANEINLIEFAQRCFDAVIIPQNVKANFIRKLANPYAVIDNEQMIQVISNLMKNAIEAMPNGGELTLEITDDNDSIIIKVADTGNGIKAENLDKIFEPFFTTKGIGFGTGLGLATSYGIVKMHKGQITVDSNADKSKGPTGTTFTITIPRNVNNISDVVK